MNKINTISELREERKRLQHKLAALELNIHTDIALIKEEFQPARIILSSVYKLFHGESNGLLGAGLNFGIDVLIKKVLFRNAGWISKLVLPFLIKNATSHIVAGQGDKLAAFAMNLFNKWNGKSKKPIYDETTAAINY